MLTRQPGRQGPDRGRAWRDLRPRLLELAAGPSHYSFTYAATLAGYDVLALDEPGTPPSDQAGGNYPPAAAVTIPDTAAALHQVMQAIGGGALQGLSFPSVILAGHSVGSAIAVTYAATYHDPAVKGLIITGFLNTSSAAGAAQVEATVYPAEDDPKFADAGLPDGYLTTMAPDPPGSVPNDRGADFYWPADSSPAVIKEDEQVKITTAGQAVAGLGTASNPALTKKITAPADLVVGQHDLLECSTAAPCTSTAAVLSRERADFSPAVPVQGLVLPGAGHSINLATNAPLAFVQEISWSLALTGHHDAGREWSEAAAAWTAQYGTHHAARR